jgi:PHP family Zn ribbon phosphoesterase
VRWFKADLHIHSVLSPCAGLEMAPRNVMIKARDLGLDIIAITDHNSCENSRVYAKAAQEFGISYIYGVEVQSAEEIHTIALFEYPEQACSFSRELYDSLLSINNDPEFFGDQVVLDEKDNIKRFIKKALINSSVWTLETVFKKISSHSGFYFPAHINVQTYSLLGQLGFIPAEVDISAFGITANCNVQELYTNYPYLQDYTLIRNSDAHYLQDVGSGISQFYLEEPTLSEIILACNNQAGRQVTV